MTSRVVLLGSLLAGMLLLGRATAVAQESLMPEQSAAKAKQIVQQAVLALGGDAYLHVRDVTCTARLSQFGHSGDLTGFSKIQDYAKLPDKDRTENIPKRNIITVMNGSQGWELDRGGVTEAAASDVARFQDDIKKDVDNIIRNRINEPGMIVRYGGADVVDLKEADWVELIDSDDRTIRIAFARSTHLPIRKVVTTREPTTRMKWDEVEYYSNYQPFNGVQTPMQIVRERNGLKVYQVFFESCEYNTNLPDSLFTKESLDERWAKLEPKKKKKKED